MGGIPRNESIQLMTEVFFSGINLIQLIPKKKTYNSESTHHTTPHCTNANYLLDFIYTEMTF